ncbi:MAG: RNA-binding protein [Clostridia bacterium]|nr:RNA-binding protein [Clostridia bacterium]
MDRNNITDKYTDYDDRLLANKILDTVEYCKKNFTYKATSFLDPRQQMLAESLLERERDVAYQMEGGMPDCERKLCIIYHEDMDFEQIEEPFKILEISWYNKGVKKPTHRDFLGSLIGSGIKREAIGDIVIQEEAAYVACTKDIADFILYNVERVGSTPVRLKIAEQVSISEENQIVINATVASLRLDSIISVGFRISRTKAAELIKSGKVRVNWEEKDLTSKAIKQNDVISIRGKGRIVLEEIMGNTKKDRIKITIRKFV